MQLHRAPERLLPSAIPCLVCHARPDFCWKWGRGTPENSLLQCINQIHSQSKSILCTERSRGPAGKKTQDISMWFNTIKLRGFLTRGRRSEICKDKLSFDNPWLGHSHTGKTFAFTTSRNKKLRHQRLSHCHLQKTAVGLKSLDIPCSFCGKVISNWLQMWNDSLHGNYP